MGTGNWGGSGIKKKKESDLILKRNWGGGSIKVFYRLQKINMNTMSPRKDM